MISRLIVYSFLGSIHIFLLFLLAPFTAIAAFLTAKVFGENPKVYKRILTIAWLLLVCNEILWWVDSRGSSDLNVLARNIPFYPCSTPDWLLPLIIFLPDRFVKTKKTVAAYMTSFVLGWLAGYFISGERIVPGNILYLSQSFHLVLLFAAVYMTFSSVIVADRNAYTRGVCLYLVLCAVAYVTNYLCYKLTNGELLTEFMYVQANEYTIPIFSSIERAAGHAAAIGAIIGSSILGSFMFRVGTGKLRWRLLTRKAFQR